MSLKDKIREEIIRKTRQMVRESGGQELLNEMRKETHKALLLEGLPYTVTTINAMVEGVKLAGAQIKELGKEEAMTQLALSGGLLMVLAQELIEEREKHIPDSLK